jgi:predicted nucleic acid-binding protein
MIVVGDTGVLTGTLGVLRAAAERGLVNVAELVARLKPTTFYADEGLLKSALAGGSNDATTRNHPIRRSLS